MINANRQLSIVHSLIHYGSLVLLSNVHTELTLFRQCRAMNRSLTNVLFGGIAPTPVAAGGPAKIEGTITKTTVDDAVEILTNAGSVIITPGYGMAGT